LNLFYNETCCPFEWIYEPVFAQLWNVGDIGVC